MSAVAGRRTYTEDELQAALRDIQSGKLGTRRAAVIYGIPRSTLRNKVYKLAMERERETHLNPSIAHKMDEDEGMDDDKELSGAEEEKEVEKALQEPLLSMADILRFSNMDTPEALRTLLQKGKEGQNPWAGLEHSSVGPYIHSLLLASGGLIPKNDGEFNPMIPELVRRMIDEDQRLLNGDNEKVTRPSPSNSVLTADKIKIESPDVDDDTPSNVILKIPSFKPTTSKNGCDLYRNAAETGSVVSPPVTSESSSPPIMPGKAMMSLRDVIAKSISQKFQQSPEPLKIHPGVEMDYKRGGFTPPLGGMSVIKNHQDMANRSYPPPPKPQHQHQQHQHQQQQGNNNSTATGGKGTRPKRGKYRNYDRDSLVEAVRAVQRGEMSVHRAGSYYGVPHSTLEYKVKERHLMRPRKRDPKPNPVDEKIASMKSQEARQNIPDKSRPSLKPPQQKFPPTSPNGMKIPPIFDPNMTAPMGYTPPPFPFWPHPGFHHLPLDYARNPSTSAFPPNPEQFFAASQMMQRLQEDASRSIPPIAPATLPKNARQMAESLLDATGANGSFLDGIIRSSLESGVPGAEDKLKREERNPAPENMSNKALLDQLCRNSRLTPLTKGPVASETNSSGDESYKKSGSPENHHQHHQQHHIQTIELSNDSNDSTDAKNGGREVEDVPPPRIYVKQQFQELTKPENLKPEVLVRMPSMNGCETQTGSASDTPDMEQD